MLIIQRASSILASTLIFFSLKANYAHNKQQEIKAPVVSTQLIKQDNISNTLQMLSQAVFEYNIMHRRSLKHTRSKDIKLLYTYRDARYLQLLNDLANKINPRYLNESEKQLLVRVYEILTQTNLKYLLTLMADQL